MILPVGSFFLMISQQRVYTVEKNLRHQILPALSPKRRSVSKCAHRFEVLNHPTKRHSTISIETPHGFRFDGGPWFAGKIGWKMMKGEASSFKELSPKNDLPDDKKSLLVVAAGDQQMLP